MQREIAALLRSWQTERAEEERVLADIMSALADLATSRQAFLLALENASRSMATTRHTATPPPLTDSITDVIMRMRQQPSHGYN